MVNYNDDALQELHDEMYREEAERPKSGFSQLDQKSKFWVGIFAAVIIVLMFMEKITFQRGLMIMGAGLVALYLMKGTGPQRKELTWLECMIRIHDLLQFLQKHPIGNYRQVPKGEIRVTPIGRKQWYEGQAFKRSFGVEIYDKEIDVAETYFVEIDVFTGDLITFRHAPEGVRGDETKDVKLMPTYDQLIEKKRANYLGQAYKKV
jgi:hypothetical protein